MSASQPQKPHQKRATRHQARNEPEEYLDNDGRSITSTVLSQNITKRDDLVIFASHFRDRVDL